MFHVMPSAAQNGGRKVGMMQQEQIEPIANRTHERKDDAEGQKMKGLRIYTLAADSWCI